MKQMRNVQKPHPSSQDLLYVTSTLHSSLIINTTLLYVTSTLHSSLIINTTLLYVTSTLHSSLIINSLNTNAGQFDPKICFVYFLWKLNKLPWR